MAYLDLSSLHGQAVAAPRDMIQTASAALSSLEWQVVAIARGDRLSSLHAPGRWAVLLQKLFGGERANPRLADPRLEALRRIAVLAWRKGDRIPANEVTAFQQAGYSAEQWDLVRTHINPRAQA